MAKEHFDEEAVEPGSEEFWKMFQDHMGYSDEEVARFRADPKRSKLPMIMGSPKMRNSTLIFEVVESHACAEGMEVGDKLYFTGVARLDPSRSSPWCAHALSCAHMHANCCQSLIVNGIDPNEMYWDHFSCCDCGTEYSWGNVKMRAYVIDETPQQ
jgi:uncharacterized repeat protein (TIGR04076 family)